MAPRGTGRSAVVPGHPPARHAPAGPRAPAPACHVHWNRLSAGKGSQLDKETSNQGEEKNKGNEKTDLTQRGDKGMKNCKQVIKKKNQKKKKEKKKKKKKKQKKKNKEP